MQQGEHDRTIEEREKVMRKHLPRAFMVIADFVMCQKEKKIVNTVQSTKDCEGALL